MAVGSKYQWESELSSPLGGTKAWRSIELMIRIEPTLKCEFCFQHKEPHWPNKCDLKRGYLTTWSGLALTLMDLKPSELLSNSEDSERVFCNLWHGFHEEICVAKKPSYHILPSFAREHVISVRKVSSKSISLVVHWSLSAFGRKRRKPNGTEPLW